MDAWELAELERDRGAAGRLYLEFLSVPDLVPGSLVFVAAHVAHRFHEIEERLVLLVAFGPAEGSRAIAT